jgi:hypothetical protein
MVKIFKEMQKWGEAKGILPDGTIAGQAKVMMEECGEWASASRAMNVPEEKDAIGDITVATVMTATLAGVELEEPRRNHYNLDNSYADVCIRVASSQYSKVSMNYQGIVDSLFTYCTIKGWDYALICTDVLEILNKRNGAMVNGTFQKEQS